MAYKKKVIDVEFSLVPVGNTKNQPTFAGGNDNTVTLSGYRVMCNVEQAGGYHSQGFCLLRIFGMAMSKMDQLSTLGMQREFAPKNTIKVMVGEEDENGSRGRMDTVFFGTITSAFTDMTGAPEAQFVVQAYSTVFAAVTNIPPTSYKGSVSVETILQKLCSEIGYQFANYGVDTILSNPYLQGSALMQIQQVIQAAGCEWNQGFMQVVRIWPHGQSLPIAAAKISPETGMIGYPFPSGEGYVGVKTLFTSSVVYGQKIDISSTIQKACGIWTVFSINHDLESEVTGGQWFTTILATPLNYAYGGAVTK